MERRQIEKMAVYHEKLREALQSHQPGWAHIIPADFPHSVSAYGNQPEDGGEYWEETFLLVVPKL